MKKWIEPPLWCTYSFWCKNAPQHLGRVVELNDAKTTGYIQYSEGQLYATECWDMSYVATFENIEDAIFYLATEGHDKSINKIREYFGFSQTVKKAGAVINWDELKRREKEFDDKKYGRKS